MDLAAINDDPDLHHTPFGRVLVSRAHSGGVAMCSIEDAASGMPMVVGLLRDGAGVFDGLHGKRQWEAWHVLDKAERYRLSQEARQELSMQDHRADFRRAIDKSLARVVDGRDMLAAAMSRTKRGHR